MARYNVADAKAHFSELVQRAMIGEEIVISKDNKPVAKLVPMKPRNAKKRPGSGKGQIVYMADDFDTTPEDFNGYLP